MNKNRIFILIAVLMVTSLACGLSQAGTQATEKSVEVVPEQTEEPLGGIFSDIGKQDPNSVPVSVQKGLSSLDYYKMTIEIETIGPSQQDITRMKYSQERAQPVDATAVSIENYTENPEDGPDSGISYIWSIGNDRCTGSDDPIEYEFDTQDPDSSEMADLLADLFDINFMIDDPTFVAEETMNGVQTNHFTFQLSGLGVESGATVLANQGEYWLAVDGDYIVRYSLLAETSSSPEKINHLKVYANLENINVPITLSMPQGCYDAQIVE